MSHRSSPAKPYNIVVRVPYYEYLSFPQTHGTISKSRTLSFATFNPNSRAHTDSEALAPANMQVRNLS